MCQNKLTRGDASRDGTKKRHKMSYKLTAIAFLYVCVCMKIMKIRGNWCSIISDPDNNKKEVCRKHLNLKTILIKNPTLILFK